MSKKKIAFLFPGQGSQYVGMGKDFKETFSSARRVFEEADERLSSHFSQLIFEGSQEELTLTKNSQLAIYIVSWAICSSVLQEYPDLEPVVCAGLSLGEYTALTAAKKITFAEGLTIVSKRASLMHEACIEHPGSMRVVLGLEELEVEKNISGVEQVWIANLNCPGQIVIAGTLQGLDRAAELLKQAGAKRVLPLDVSGAFHSGLMQQAQEGLVPYLSKLSIAESPVDIVMNTPGDYVRVSDEVRAYLIRQVTQPVRWQKGIAAMASAPVDLFIEMGCGKTLQGMNKRIGISVPTLSIEKVSEMEPTLKEIEVVV